MRWWSLALAGSLVLAGGRCPAASPDGYWQGVRQFGLRQTAAAIHSFEAVVKAHPHDAMAHVMLSRSYLQGGQPQQAFDESIAGVRDIATAGPADHYVVNAWGWRMRALHFPREAAQALASARWNADYGIALYPTRADLYVLRGDLETSPAQAATFYQAALLIDPHLPQATWWKPPHPALPAVSVQPLSKPLSPIARPPLFTGLGTVHLQVASKAQAYVTQGMDELYSYVRPAAKLSFQYATQLDPHCAMAWWGLSFCVDNPREAAGQALVLARRYGTAREQWYCTARVLQVSASPQFPDVLDGALAHWPKDPDLWIWRGTTHGVSGETSDDQRVCNDMPYVLIAWRLQPDHPGANHELVHAYETIDRPIMGWPYGLAYQRCAPHMPHAQHMLAHLAMRLGRWDDALACTRASLRDARHGFPEEDPSHHRLVYLWVLGHEGCFREARHAPRPSYEDLAWPRLYRLALDLQDLKAWARRREARHDADGWYVEALADLEEGNTAAARKLLPRLRVGPPTWYGAIPQVWAQEIEGRLHGAAGLPTLQRLAQGQDALVLTHRWGQGAYFDETWGESALRAGHLDDAQEAFEEALAHEHGSIVGALGLQVVWERRHDAARARDCAVRAQAIWHHADPEALARLLERLRQVARGQAPMV